MAFVPAFPVTGFLTSSTTSSRISSTVFHQRKNIKSPSISTQVNKKTVTVSVLDTPASNTYLQRHAELVVRDFLTRRAVNTAMYYMHELGDGPTHNWLSKFDNFSEKVKAHTFKNGDEFLERMLKRSDEECKIKIGHPNGRFSRTFNITIQPRKIAQRIIDIRLQLSKEWSKDLRCIDNENLELKRLSFEKLLSKNETELDSKKNLIFDSDPLANDQTPLRYKNYNALKTLITQHSITRLLPYLRDKGSNHEYMYLLQFLNSYGIIADGDKFLNDLMSKSPELRTNPTFTVIPKSIASQVMELRSIIAAEWITVMDFIPVEHELNLRSKLEKSIDASMDLPEDLENGSNNKNWQKF